MINTKKGDIWISAVLYFGLGIVVIAIILAAATPVINRLRDKNIILQTKDVFQVLDSNIREVGREGPGSQRPLTIDIRKGEFKIDNKNDQITWLYNSKALVSEVGAPILEGNLKIVSAEQGPSNTYPTTLSLDYASGVYLNYKSQTATITGSAALVIRNIGVSCGPAVPDPTDPLKYSVPDSAGSGDACLCDPSHIVNVPTDPCPAVPLPTIEIVQR